ncbi:G-protein coupled receptor moody isoform X2 [Zeugodacus cucurbitae]|nr:G-protein coupled receptor moody isoform X2 [Zeugodacus cucurbitae]XP_054088413.1 G-protein coupled receptor moody isoform X2 [Zeugodacus cucurbitae]
MAFNISAVRHESPGVELFEGYSEKLLMFASVACIIFMIVGIPGNMINIIALARGKQTRNSTAIFIMNLSSSDLLFDCFNLPLAASTFLRRSWIHGELLCRFFPLMRYGLLAVSLFTVSLITINRYIIIAHPRQYSRIYQRRYLALMIAGTWITAFSIMIPTWRGIWGRFGLDTSIGSCSILLDKNGHTPKEFLFIAAFVVPCICIVVCYARILYLVRKAAFRSRETPGKNITFQNEAPTSRRPNSEKNQTNNQDLALKTPNVVENQPIIKPFDVYEDLEYIDVSDSNDNGQEVDEIIKVNNSGNNTNVKEKLNEASKAQIVDLASESKKTQSHKGFITTSLKTSFNRITPRKSHYVSMGNTSNASSIYPGRMSQKDRRLLKMILVIFISFLFCHLPITVTKLWKSTTDLHIVNISGYLLIYLTTCINPIIYVMMSSEYRQAYWNLLRCRKKV